MAVLYVKCTLILLLALCLHIGAEPLGLAAYGTKRNYLDFELSAPATSFKARGLKQTRESAECALSEDAIGNLLDGGARVWSLDDAALSDFGLQSIIDCTQEGDIVLFDLDEVFKPTKRIVIPWNLTLSSSVGETALIGGIFPSSASKVRMTCPDDDLGIFLVESADALFANLVFEDCVLSEDSEDAAIVAVGSCDSDEGSGTIGFHHVDFSKNSLAGASGLDVSTGGCSSVMMLDVGFEENDCEGNCGAVLSAKGNILIDLRITNNTARNETSEMSAVIVCPPNSTTRAGEIVASGNEVAGFFVNGAVFDIEDSSFRENRIRAGGTSASGLILRISEAKIRNCEFKDNSGDAGSSAVSAVSCPSVEISGCSFQGNNASPLEGGAIYSILTQYLKITDSDFTENAGNNGGAVYLQITVSEIVGCRFRRNEATVSGGGIYIDLGTVDINDTDIEDNYAEENGGGIYSEDSTLTADSVTLTRNEAGHSGGCFDIPRLGSFIFTNSVFSECEAEFGAAVDIYLNVIGTFDSCSGYNNSATVSGGFVYVEDANLTVKDSLLLGNEARDGAGVFAISSILSLKDTNITDNSGTGEGGGIYSEDSSLEADNVLLLRNTATESGGCVDIAELGSFAFTNSVFSECSAEFGGGLDIGAGANGSIVSCRGSGNNASRSGGFAYFDQVNVSIQELDLSNNVAISGAGFFVDDSSVTIKDANITDNYAGNDGGGIYSRNSTFSADNVVLMRNEAANSGGCFDIPESGSFVFTNSVFSECSAEFGGGLDIGAGANGSIVSCRGSNNKASAGGGFVYILRANVTIQDSEVTENDAVYGAGFFMIDSSVTIKDVNITDNYASEDGGGIYSENCTVEADNVLMLRNEAVDSGGCFDVVKLGSFVISNSVFSQCKAEFGAGIDIGPDATGSLIRCRGSNNIAEKGGGFIYVGSANVSIEKSEVSNNRAESGGGVFTATSSVVTIKDTNFEDNFAGEDGGGIYSKDSTLVADNVTLLNNQALDAGGGLHCPGYGSFTFTNSVFRECRAVYGAAVYILLDVSGTLDSCSGYNNSAFTSGGFAYVQQSNLTIIGGEFLGNSATFGGGVLLSAGWLLMKDSVFAGGSATVKGGAITSLEGSYIIAEDVRLHDNQAVLGGCIYTEKSYTWAKNFTFTGCRAKEDGGGLRSNDSSSFLCSGCSFRNNSAQGNGGGAYIESEVGQLLAYQFDDTSFEFNRAALGGGINFVSEVGLKNCSDPEETCTFLALRGTAFRGNGASTAGGGIMSRDLNSIRFSCSYNRSENPFVYLTREEYYKLRSIDSLDTFCDEWKLNAAESYGDNVGSFARGIKNYIWLDDFDEPVYIKPNFYILRDHRSGSPLPDLYFESVDQLGQGPAIGLLSGGLTAKMTSPDKLFEGSNEVQFTEGSCNFTGTTIYKEAGLYQVVVNFSDPSIPQFSMTVRIRDCVIGEAPSENRVLCQPCNGDTYNFYPQREDPGCVPCPDHGNCSTHVILPSPGYWHFTPCSTHIQECLSERACKDGARYDDLKDLGDGVSSCNFSSDFIAEYADAQCAKGYRGPLCGSCEASYGRSRAFRCEKCFSGFGNFVLVVITLLTLLLLSIVAIRSSLPNQRRSKKGLETGERMAELAIHGRSLIRARQTEDENNGEQGGATAAVSEYEMAKWRAVEIFKITINYLQVIAIAVSVNVTWNDALIAAFETAEFIGGVTSEAATRSVDCLVSDDSTISRSAVRTVVGILIPLLVTGFWAVFWAAAMFRHQESMRYLSKRSILSVCAVSYLSYIAVTKTAVNVLYCVDVYDSPDFESDSATAYWAVDTQLKCYEGSHAILAGIIGWPVVIFYSFGFPVIVAGTLIAARNREGTQSEWLYESMGFLYRAYSSEYVFWEAAIMLRKAVLAVVVVFAYPLGGNLQGVMAVCVLIVASYFHVRCCPFREEFDDLNQFEGLSLLVSSLTFVCGQFYNDDHTSNAARVLITICLFCANLGLLAFFAFALFRSGGNYLQARLDSEGIEYDPAEGTFGVIKAYLKSRFGKYLDWFFGFEARPSVIV